MRTVGWALLGLFVFNTWACSHLPKGGRLGESSSAYRSRPYRAQAIKEVFRDSWDAYMEFAFPGDTLRPFARSAQNDRNGWGASAVDALSTALLMDENDIVNTILEYIPTIDFDQTDTPISVFETTIRYLGGLVSGFDLLRGPFASLGHSDQVVHSLLHQAQRLASNLLVAFDTPSAIPDNVVEFNPVPRRYGMTSNSLATVGTLVLEWTRIADLTGDCFLANVTQNAENYLLFPNEEVWPGLLGSAVFTDNGTFIDQSGGWGAGTDSFYEYLIKMYIYDPVRFGIYKDRWIAAVDSTIEHLLSHPSTDPDSAYRFLASYADGVQVYRSGHLACFAGGNFILGGLVLGEPLYVNVGIDLTEGCHELYANTVTGIGPEIYQWQDSKATVNNPEPPQDQRELYGEDNFWIDMSQYVLRPEVIESYYYAYRATGDAKFQDWAWDAFVAINKSCNVGNGFVGIMNVNNEGGGGFYDFQESFWFAETLKYSYLIQTEDWGEVQLKTEGENQWVFNTEGHPIKLPCWDTAEGCVCGHRCPAHPAGRPVIG